MPVQRDRHKLADEIVKNYIISAIGSAKYQPNDKLPSEAELCKLFSVSRFAVRKAITDLVYKQVIYQVASKGTFVVDRGCRQVLKAGVVVPLGVSDPFMGSIVTSLERELSRLNINLQLVCTENDQAIEEERLRKLVRDGVQGIVVWTSDCPNDEKSLDVYSSLGVPLVFIDRYIPELSGDRVIGRDREAAILATRHLLGHGRTKLGFFGSDKFLMSPVKDRLLGMKAVMDEVGIELDPRRVVEFIPIDRGAKYQDLFNLDKRMISDFIRNNPDLDGVLIVNELTAAKFCLVCRELGVSIPDDIAIIAFSDSDVCKYLNPQLTTFDQDPGRIGQEAAKRLSSRMLGVDLPDGIETTIRIDYRLIVRESCGCKAEHDHKDVKTEDSAVTAR